MTEAYYPRHSELERPEDTEADTLQARIYKLERLLREVARDYVGECHRRCQPDCLGERIRKALEASHGE